MTKTANKAVSAAQTVAPSVAVSPEDARQILSLHRTVESAERNFHRCQSNLFRHFVVEKAEAKNVSAAFARLHDALEALEKAEGPNETEV